jgi:uncharacterized protein
MSRPEPDLPVAEPDLPVAEPDLPVAEPAITLETEPFWTAAAEGRLLLPRCDRCGTVVWYPRRFCPECRGTAMSWFEASGRGRVYSFTVVRKASGEWSQVVPYVIAYVELEEGPRILTNVVGPGAESVTIGASVEVVFERSGSGAAVPRFRVSD